ncbi:MAG: hypothetical protein HYS18_02500 [Burkholderiales bacterium]|nr:hypothetical protein [Burkholderiales bacterium]
MQLYYSSLQAIEQQTMQLDDEPCRHCRQSHHLISHGFIRKKRSGAEPEAVGKRVYCSNRNRHTGCGRTVQLYIDSTIRYLRHAGECVVAFALSLIKGLTIQYAYHAATGTDADTPRNAYRWLHRLSAQLSVWRSLAHKPPLQDAGANAAAHAGPRQLLTSTFAALLQHFGQPLCAHYQRHTQRPFL